MAELVDRNDVFTAAVFDAISAQKTVLGLEDVWMGDQERVPRTPCVAVEPGGKVREYSGVPRRFLITFEIYVLVYVERIQDTQKNTRQSLKLSEEVEAVLHADETMGGIVISSHVSESNAGYVVRSGTLLSAIRLTFRATSQKSLPYP